MPKVVIDAELADQQDEDQAFEAEQIEPAIPKTEDKAPAAVAKPVEPTAEEKKAAEDKAAADKKVAEDEAAAKAKKDEEDGPYTLTKKQFAALQAEIAEGKEAKKSFQSLSGTVGNLRQELDSIKRVTPIELTDADFAELVKEFPEIAPSVKKGFSGVLKRLIGMNAPKGAGDEEIKKAIFAAVNARESEVLEDEFPDWKDTVGKVADTEHPYRKWLAVQTPQYQDKLAKTFSGSVIARSIRRFQAEQERAVKEKAEADRKAAEADAAKKAGNGRTAALRAAVQPKGDGGGLAPAKGEQTEEEAMEQGFKEG